MRALLLLLLLGVSPAAAQQLPPSTNFVGCVTGLDPTFATGAFGRLRCDSQGNLLTTGGGGGGGGSGPYYVGQYNSTLPTFANGQAGYVALDSNGRVIQSPGASVTVSNAVTVNQGTSPWTIGGSVTATLNQGGSALSTSNPIFVQVTNFPPSQAVTNAGTFAVQNTAATPAGTNNIGSLTNITGTVSLPTGASTAANQATEITALQSIQQRALLYQDFGNTSAGASAVVSSAIRDLGVSPNYTKVNLVAFSTQAGTYKILGCQDSACATPLTLAQSAITAGGYVTVTAPVVTRYYLLQYTNGSTAGSIYANTSFTAN